MKKYSYINSVLFLSVMTAIFFFPALFLGKTMFLRDITYIFHPWKTLCAEAIQRGEMPLWNPYAYCGMPLLANWQTAVFYPLSILFSIFSFTTALKAFHFVHIFLAGYFAFLFVRGERGNIPAAAAVMAMFAFNGFIITKLEFLSYAGVISWTFALLLLRNNPLTLSVAICVSFLAGHQIFIFQIFALLIYVLFDSISEKNGLIPLQNIVTAGAVSTGLAAAQLLPTLELIKYSNRSREGIAYAIAMLHSLSFKSLPGLLSPLLYKARLDLVGGEYLQWDTTMYIGFFGVFASLLGLFAKSFNIKKVVAIAFIALGTLLALGDSTPVYPWLYKHLFIFHTMRYPVQYVYFTITGLTILAGEGINNFKFGYLAAGLIAIELLITSINFQPLTEDGFFTHRPQAAAVIQSLGPNSRFILSPGTEVDRHIAAKSIPLAWQGARDRLYNLTCLPYHLQNAFGFGEPLTGFAIETKINELYNLPDAQSALGKYAALGVSYVLCKQPLADRAGYKLVADNPLFIYQLVSNPSLVETAKPGAKAEALFNRSRPCKYIIHTESLEKDTITFKECYSTGWELYLNGSRSVFSVTDSMFPKWDAPGGNTRAYYVYRPLSFFVGVIISLLTLLALAGLSSRRFLRFHK